MSPHVEDAPAALRADERAHARRRRAARVRLVTAASVGLGLCAAGVCGLVARGAVTHRHLACWGGAGDRPGSFDYIEELDVDSQGNLYVVDKNTALVTVFNPDGQLLRSLGGRPWLDTPEGLAVDSRGNVLVSDFRLNAVFKFAPDGKLLWHTRGEEAAPLEHPAMVDVGTDDSVWVVDSGNNRVQVFDAGGAFLRRFGAFGFGPGQMRNPEGICVDPRTGAVWIADSENGRVQEFDRNGVFRRAIDGPHGLDKPIGVAIHPRTGRLYVTEYGASCVQVFEPDGGLVTSFGRAGSSAGEFTDLHGIAIDACGRVFLGDTGNNRVQVFASEPNGAVAAP